MLFWTIGSNQILKTKLLIQEKKGMVLVEKF